MQESQQPKDGNVRMRGRYKAKLRQLAQHENRSMMNMNEVLIDRAYALVKEELENTHA